MPSNTLTKQEIRQLKKATGTENSYSPESGSRILGCWAGNTCAYDLLDQHAKPRGNTDANAKDHCPLSFNLEGPTSVFSVKGERNGQSSYGGCSFPYSALSRCEGRALSQTDTLHSPTNLTAALGTARWRKSPFSHSLPWARAFQN